MAYQLFRITWQFGNIRLTQNIITGPGHGINWERVEVLAWMDDEISDEERKIRAKNFLVGHPQFIKIDSRVRDFDVIKVPIII